MVQGSESLKAVRRTLFVYLSRVSASPVDRSMELSSMAKGTMEGWFLHAAHTEEGDTMKQGTM